ncbi:MAG: ATP-dependent helicase [Thermoanaerobaculales bacterium]|jgi:DNA helicase-2/ATP-dependent DNA helicase PcrA|nr:ATP-dependent helicase [Thermoanaerobaculales bacterium]
MSGRLRAGGRGGRYRVQYECELNEQQVAAVMHPGGPILALAGAGTGKTRTLVYRACRLIEDGVPPGRILLLTFTNKAAREMLGRVEQLVEHGGSRVTGGTFHAAGHRILRRFADLLGYTPRFSIVDREDSVDLMGAAQADVTTEIPSVRAPRPRLLVELYSFVINTGRPLDEVLAGRAPQFADQGETMAEVFRRYLERKRRADLMDFDDLLLNWLLLLTRHATAREELRRRFDHILVDEYQDTNRLQADIVDAMLGPERNLMVVGDDAQSIYGFRGAEFDNILGFPERHPGCTVLRLETNYRSVPPILALANASIAHNRRQFAKVLRPERSGGEMPLEIALPTPEAQAAHVADRLLELREEGYELEEMAVLYRNHAHSLDLQVELTKRNIPFRVRSGLRFFEHRHVKDVLAHLRFVDNPRDEVAFARLVKLRDGFGPRLAARLWDRLASGPDPVQALVRLEPGELALPRAATGSLAELRLLVGELSAASLLAQPGEAVRHVVESFYAQWARAHLEAAGARIEDLEQLALFADGYPDINTFLSEVTLLNDLSGEDAAVGPPDEMLTLSTVHQAKGIEWRAVFVIWLAEGRFPGFRMDDEEEERRLFYVAVTRARDRLFLVRPEIARDRYRVDVLLEPSRFLAELPPGVRELLAVAEAAPPDGLSALPAGGRYRLPGFVDPLEDDGVS